MKRKPTQKAPSKTPRRLAELAPLAARPDDQIATPLGVPKVSADEWAATPNSAVRRWSGDQFARSVSKGARKMPFLKSGTRLVRLRATRDAVVRGLDDVQRVGAPRLCPLGADIRDYEYRSEREAGLIPRPLHQPIERLFAREDSSVHMLMDRIEALDREVGLPFGGSFS